MYRCQQGDEVIFSREPCGPDARTMDVEYDTPPPASAADAEARAEQVEAEAASGIATVERQARIEALEREIETLRNERDRAIEQLADKQQRGTEERADDTYWEDMSMQMQAVMDRYRTRIKFKEAELERLRRTD